MKTLPGVYINSDHVLLIGKVGIRLKRIRGKQVTKKFDMDKLKNEERKRKLQGNFQGKPTNLETPSGNSNEYWIHLKSCIQTNAEDTIGYKESNNIKKPWVTGKMFKME